MTTSSYVIQGMTCGGCVNRVNRALQKVTGVQEAHVELGRATVTFDPAIISEAGVREAIDATGYLVADENAIPVLASRRGGCCSSRG